MATKKLMNYFDILKNTEKQGAWLLMHGRELDLQRDDKGNLTVDIEDIDGSHSASAWTTQMAAKRQGAKIMGRSRLTWIDVKGDGTHLSCHCPEKVTSNP